MLDLRREEAEPGWFYSAKATLPGWLGSKWHCALLDINRTIIYSTIRSFASQWTGFLLGDLRNVAIQPRIGKERLWCNAIGTETLTLSCLSEVWSSSPAFCYEFLKLFEVDKERLGRSIKVRKADVFFRPVSFLVEFNLANASVRECWAASMGSTRYCSMQLSI